MVGIFRDTALSGIENGAGSVGTHHHGMRIGPSLRPFETIDVALVAAGVTHVQGAGTTMRAAAAKVQRARLSALLEDLRLRGLCRLLPRCWSLPSRGLAFGFPRRLLLLRHVVSSVACPTRDVLQSVWHVREVQTVRDAAAPARIPRRRY